MDVAAFVRNILLFSLNFFFYRVNDVNIASKLFSLSASYFIYLLNELRTHCSDVCVVCMFLGKILERALEAGRQEGRL